MDAWWDSSNYASVGVYIGGVSMGCAQPNLSAAWVSRQVSRGWHLVPVYVGLQAPCSGFARRMSYDVPTARAQGEAEAADAMDRAALRGIVAPSTLYSDMEGYDSSDTRCVNAVMSYLSGWTFEMHTAAYEGGVYSSASSGMHDLSTHYDSMGASRPDDLFMAWWNHQADVDGGSYVPKTQWSFQQRVHQFDGQVTERHGGYTMQIDRDFLDVSSVVQEPEGCPTNLDFKAYPLLRWPTSGDGVRAVQCLLALRGFDPGPATGIFNWRTAGGIRAFKASRGLSSQTSSVARYAWTALLSAGTTKPLQFGSTGPWVRKVQRTLTARLQRTVTISGVFGTRTRVAVRVYQRTVGLTPTGTVGPPTWRALRSGR
jgi:peptidoglycan hydrolase-like protein with peptidoglycan-binding domain